VKGIIIEMAYFLNSLKDKATSYIQQQAEKMLIPHGGNTSPNNGLTDDREEVLDIIVDDDDAWGNNT
jgi:hypothetical protein